MHVVQNQKDSVVVRTSKVSDFVASIGKQQPGALDERSFDEIIYIDRELASAWAPYTFHRNGQFSHKGIDSFQFVKLKEGWKIQYLIYNMYQYGENCYSLKKGANFSLRLSGICALLPVVASIK